jgi:ParB-like chromosome segregation protein Spo0J
MEEIPVDIPVDYNIMTLPEVQPRIELSASMVAEYADLMRDGVRFPPIVVFSPGEKTYILADGFHRFEAAKVAGKARIDCEVHQGSAREAQLYALRANSIRGVSLAQEEKRNAAMKLPKDETWRTWTDGAIARWCGVSPMTIGRIRKGALPRL